jgi:Helix-turn-helix domain
MDDLAPVKRFEWERIIRRVRMTPSVKLVALVLATYANRDGGSAHPGVAHLVNVTGLGKRTVIRALEELRNIGLIERTFAGSHAGRRGLADVYRLSRPHDLLSVVPMLSVDEDQVSPGLPDPGPVEPEPTGPRIVWPHGDQGAEVSPDYAGTGAISDTEQVPSATEQGAVVTGTGDTSAPPHTHTPTFLHQADHNSAARLRAPVTGRCPHRKPIGKDHQGGLICGECEDEIGRYGVGDD